MLYRTCPACGSNLDPGEVCDCGDQSSVSPVSVTRQVLSSREEWLAARVGIGASDCAGVLGMSGFKSPVELWKEKAGIVQPKGLSENRRVSFGNQAEEPLRHMFRLMHPEYGLTFEPYTILRRCGDYDFLFCTPDGELVEKSTGRKGVYESKTATCLSRADWERWNCQIPKAYYMQICQQMYCGNFDFAVVWALLLDQDGDASLRAYTFAREDCEADIEWMLPQTAKFWKNVQSGTMPSLKLSL